jgi:hypothetical protein
MQFSSPIIFELRSMSMDSNPSLTITNRDSTEGSIEIFAHPLILAQIPSSFIGLVIRLATHEERVLIEVEIEKTTSARSIPVFVFGSELKQDLVVAGGVSIVNRSGEMNFTAPDGHVFRQIKAEKGSKFLELKDCNMLGLAHLNLYFRGVVQSNLPSIVSQLSITVRNGAAEPEYVCYELIAKEGSYEIFAKSLEIDWSPAPQR